MKKFLILSLIFLYACGPSNEEIQAEIDEAVNKALQEATSTTVSTTSSTTTLPTTTTTTVDLVSICKENVIPIKAFATDFLIMHDNYYGPFEITIFDELPENASQFNFQSEKVQKKWIELQMQVDKLLQEERSLAYPEKGTLYEDYHFTVTQMTSYFYEIISDWQLIEIGMDSSIKFEEIKTKYDFFTLWVDEYNNLPYCSSTNY